MRVGLDIRGGKAIQNLLSRKFTTSALRSCLNELILKLPNKNFACFQEAVFLVVKKDFENIEIRELLKSETSIKGCQYIVPITILFLTIRLN